MALSKIRAFILKLQRDRLVFCIEKFTFLKENFLILDTKRFNSLYMGFLHLVLSNQNGLHWKLYMHSFTQPCNRKTLIGAILKMHYFAEVNATYALNNSNPALFH